MDRYRESREIKQLNDNVARLHCGYKIWYDLETGMSTDKVLVGWVYDGTSMEI